MTYWDERWGRALVPIASALSLYSVGAGALEGFIAYPSWREVGAPEFAAFHRVTDSRVVGVLVVPFSLATAATAWLAVRPPSGLPRWLPCAALAAQTVTWASTLAVEIPLQRALTRDGYSRARLDRLIRFDRLTRQLPNLALAVLSVAMTVVASSRSRGERA